MSVRVERSAGEPRRKMALILIGVCLWAVDAVLGVVYLASFFRAQRANAPINATLESIARFFGPGLVVAAISCFAADLLI